MFVIMLNAKKEKEIIQEVKQNVHTKILGEFSFATYSELVDIMSREDCFEAIQKQLAKAVDSRVGNYIQNEINRIKDGLIRERRNFYDGLIGLFSIILWITIIGGVVYVVVYGINHASDPQLNAEYASCRDGYTIGCISAIDDQESGNNDQSERVKIMKLMYKERTGHDIQGINPPVPL